MADENNNRPMTTLGLTMRRFGQSLMRHYQSPLSSFHSPPDTAQNQAYKTAVNIPLDWDGVIERRVNGNQPVVDEFDTFEQAPDINEGQFPSIRRPIPSSQPVQREATSSSQTPKKKSKLDPRLQRIVEFHKERNKSRDAERERRVQRWRDAQEKGASTPDSQQPAIPGWKSKPKASFDYIETSALIKGDHVSPQKNVPGQDDDQATLSEENDSPFPVRSRVDEVGHEGFEPDTEDGDNFEIDEPYFDYSEGNQLKGDNQPGDTNMPDFKQTTSPRIQRDIDSQNTRRRNPHSPRKQSSNNTGQTKAPESRSVDSQNMNHRDDNPVQYDPAQDFPQDFDDDNPRQLSNFYEDVNEPQVPNFYENSDEPQAPNFYEDVDAQETLDSYEDSDEAVTPDFPVYRDDGYEAGLHRENHPPESTEFQQQSEDSSENIRDFREASDAEQRNFDGDVFPQRDSTNTNPSDNTQYPQTFQEYSTPSPDIIHRAVDATPGNQRSNPPNIPVENPESYGDNFTQHEANPAQFRETDSAPVDEIDYEDDHSISSPQISFPSQSEFMDDGIISPENIPYQDEYPDIEQLSVSSDARSGDAPEPDSADFQDNDDLKWQAQDYSHNTDDIEQKFEPGSVSGRNTIQRRIPDGDFDYPREFDENDSFIPASRQEFVDTAFEQEQFSSYSSESMDGIQDNRHIDRNIYEDDSMLELPPAQYVSETGESIHQTDYDADEVYQSSQNTTNFADNTPASSSQSDMPQKPPARTIQRYMGDDGQLYTREIEDSQDDKLPEQTVDVYQAMMDAGILTKPESQKPPARTIQRYMGDDGQLYTREVEHTQDDKLPEQPVDVYQAMMDAGIVKPSETSSSRPARPHSDESRPHNHEVREPAEQNQQGHYVEKPQKIVEPDSISPPGTDKNSRTPASSRFVQRYMGDDGQLYTGEVEDTQERSLPQQPVDVYQAMMNAGIVKPVETNNPEQLAGRPASAPLASEHDSSSRKAPVPADIQQAMLQRLREKNAEVARNPRKRAIPSQTVQRTPDKPSRRIYSGKIQRTVDDEPVSEPEISEDEAGNIQQLTRDVFREIRRRIRDEIEKHNRKS